MQFAAGIPALLHKANVHRKIFLQQILNLPKGILPTPAFAFDEGPKTTALINHKSEFLVKIFSNVVFDLHVLVFFLAILRGSMCMWGAYPEVFRAEKKKKKILFCFLSCLVHLAENSKNSSKIMVSK